MPTVRSADGTPIAYETTGRGPALILVDGALCYRASGPSRPMAARLAERFTVLAYDRRGRGESGDTAPYALEREVEDLEALLGAAGGSASVLGFSSGAALALEAAHRGLPIERLVLYEPPFIVDDTRPPLPADFVPHLASLLAAERRAEAVQLFLKVVGMPAFLVGLMRFFPGWSRLKGVAHTLPYDFAFVEAHQRGRPLPAGRWSPRVPTLVAVGGKSPAWMRNAMRELAEVLPGAEHRTLDGQTHMVKPRALAPVLTEFLAS